MPRRTAWQPQRLYVSLDGTMASLRDPWKRDGSCGRLHCGYGECKTAVCYETRPNRQGTPVVARHQSTATLEPVETFDKLVAGLAYHCGSDRAPELVVLADGLGYNWRLGEEYLPEALQVLDFDNTLDQLHRLARLCLEGSPGAGEHAWSPAAAWVALQKEALLRDGVIEVAAAIEALPASSLEAQECREETQGYSARNAERMRYRTFLDAGYQIGSGVMEAGCKTVAHQRLDQSGNALAAGDGGCRSGPTGDPVEPPVAAPAPAGANAAGETPTRGKRALRVRCRIQGQEPFPRPSLDERRPCDPPGHRPKLPLAREMKLTRENRAKLHTALQHAFPSFDDLKLMVSLQLDENLEAITGTGRLQHVVFQLINWAEAESRLIELIQGARQQVPGNLELDRLASTLVPRGRRDLREQISLCDRSGPVGDVRNSYHEWGPKECAFFVIPAPDHECPMDFVNRVARRELCAFEEEARRLTEYWTDRPEPPAFTWMESSWLEIPPRYFVRTVEQLQRDLRARLQTRPDQAPPWGTVALLVDHALWRARKRAVDDQLRAFLQACLGYPQLPGNPHLLVFLVLQHRGTFGAGETGESGAAASLQTFRKEVVRLIRTQRKLWAKQPQVAQWVREAQPAEIVELPLGPVYPVEVAPWLQNNSAELGLDPTLITDLLYSLFPTDAPRPMRELQAELHARLSELLD